MRRRWLVLAAVVAWSVVPAGALAGAAEAAFGPLGGDVRISFMGPDGNPSYGVSSSSAAYNPTANEYLVVWAGDEVTGSLVDNELEIFAQRVSASGAPLGGRIRVSDMGPDGNPAYGAFFPSVAYSAADNQYLVTWMGDDNTAPLVDDEYEVFGQRLTAAGVEGGANDFRISDMGPDGNPSYGTRSPSVAYSSADNQFLVTWVGADNTAPPVLGEYEVFGQLLDRAGVEGGANDFRISDMGPDGNPFYGPTTFDTDVVYSAADNQFLVIWVGDDNTAPLVEDEFEVFGQRLTAAGVEGGANDFRISDMGPDGNPAYDASSPSVAYSSADNQFLVTWAGDDNTASLINDEFEVFGQRLTAAGVEGGANDFRISDMGSDFAISYGATFGTDVVYSAADNQFLVTWAGDDDTPPLVDDEFEVFGQRLDRAGVEGGANDFRISDLGPDGNPAYDAVNPSVAYSSADNQFLVTWVGDDNTAPLVEGEFEVFSQRLGDPPPPGGGGTPGPTGAGPLAFGARTLVTLKLAAKRIPARGPLKVRVANANGFAVTGALSAQTVNPVSVARKRRIKLEAKSFGISAKTTETVKLKLPSALRRLLQRTGKLSLRLTAKVNDPAANTRTLKKKITPRLKKERRR